METRCKVNSPIRIFLIMITALLLCVGSAWADTNVGGTISTDTVWDLAGSPYIVTGSITIAGGDGTDELTTLTLEPGVEVRFNANTFMYIGASSGNPGALAAQGTASAPIRFTANTATPSPGFWRGLIFRNTTDDATTRLEHCTVEYAGYGGVISAVQVDYAAPRFTACQFINNTVTDLHYSGTVGGAVTDCIFNHGLNFAGSGQVAFDGNTFNWDNSYPVRLPADNVGSFVATAAFTGLDSTSAIQVTGNYLTLDATWKAAIPYAMTGTLYIQGVDGADGVTTLTLEPGAELRFNANRYLYVGSSSGDPGALAAQGTASAPIRFTANTATPTAGFWYGLYFRDTTDDTTTRLEHCTVEYAGYGNISAVQVGNAAPSFTGCEFANNAATDLYYSGTVGGTVSGCTFNNGINFAGSGQVAFDGNTFNWDNNFPVSLPADNVGPLVATAAFTGLDSTSAIQVTGSTLTLDAVWKAAIPYAITSSLRIQGADGADGVTSLTLEPGAELRFNANRYLYIGSSSGDPGALAAQGTAAAPIHFTANSTTPTAGFWYGLYFQDTTDDATTQLEHCTVEYAGYGNVSAVQVGNAAPSFTGCEFANNAATDLYYYSGAEVGGAVTNCTFNHGLNFAGSGQVAFDGNTFNWDNSFPVRLPADNVGPLVATAAFTGLDSTSAIQVTGSTLTLDAVWKAAIPYAITSSLRIQGADGADGVTSLTLEPGAELRFNANRYLYIGSSSGDPGALAAQGTAAAPILFTANTATPSAGFWSGLNFQNTTDDATTHLQHCTVEYAGYGNAAAARVGNAAPSFTGCEFANNAATDLYYYSGAEVGGAVTNCIFNHGINFAGSGQVAFAGNTFNWDNNYPVSLPVDNVGPLVATAAFTGLDSTSAIQVTGSTLTLDAVWKAAIPYAITSSLRIQGVDGADGVTTLTLEPGAELRFNVSRYLYIGSSSGDPGALAAQGTAAAPIRFTANTATPSAGFWNALYFQNTTHDATTRLEHCIVEYGGRSNNGQIYIGRATPAIRYSNIRNSGNYGIYTAYSESSGTIIECNNIKDNTTGVYVSGGSQPVIGGNNFINNQSYGVHNAGSAQVSAINNWWGDAGGPNLTGDAVYGNVTFEPWRTEPSDCVESVPVNDAPLAPTDPVPAHSATQVDFPDQTITLGWTGVDPNPSDTLTFDVMWGTDSQSLTLAAQDLAAATYAVTGIQPGTAYYWQIISRDNHGSETSGPVWQFTTADPQPDLVISELTWTPSADITAGQTIAFTATLQNNGPGTLTENIYVGFRFNGQNATNHSVTADLAPGQTVQINRNWVAQVGALAVETIADSTSAVAENDESNNNRTADLGTIPDAAPPEMNSTSPADGAFVQTVNQITVHLIDSYGGAVDTAATANSFAITLDGSQSVPGTVQVNGNSFVFTPATAPLAQGTYQVSLTAHDTAGNSQAYSFSFTVDNQVPAEPVVTGGTVTGGTIQPRPVQNRSNKTTVTLTGTREDNTAILINGSQRVSLGSGPWSVNLSLPQGDNALEISARDAAANMSNPVWVDIQVDSIAPAVDAVTPAADSFLNSVPAAVTVSFTEAVSGLDAGATQRSLKNGSLVPVGGTWTDSAGQMQFIPGAALTDDTYTLEMRLTDNLGNSSGAVQSIFTVDTTAPPAPAINPVTTPTHTVTQTISGQKEAFAAIYSDGAQVVDHTSSTTWQHTVHLTSGDNHFSFTARDRAGNESPATPVTIAFDDVAPPAVTTLTADGNGSGTTVTLNWTGYNEAAHGDVQSYRIYCEPAALNDVSGLTVKATVGAGTFAHTVDSLTAGTTYWFAVVAVDTMGNMNPAVTAVSGTPSDTQPPEEITNLSVQSFADRLLFSWTASAASAGDLSGYKVYFNGAATPQLLPESQTTYEATGLAASSAYPIRVSAYDTQDNESAGVTLSGYTWLDNPGGLTADPYSGYVELTWSPVTPAANLSYYAVYLSTSGPFVSVQGMTPVVTSAAAQTRVAGLTNGQTYYFAVTAVNRSDGQRPDVTTVSAAPAEDTAGPQLSAVQIDGQPLASGHTISSSAVVTLAAEDPAGISRIDFQLDGNTLFTDYNAPYGCSLDILTISDGTHTLGIIAYDTLDNATTQSYSLNVNLSPPPAPTITQPADGQQTNAALITVQGQADLNTEVQVYLEGQTVGGPMAVDAAGRFNATVTLAEGDNHIQAAAVNRAGTGPMSAQITVTLDTTVPLAPVNVTAQAVEAGQVRLSWQAPDGGKAVTGYHVYRHDASFPDTASALRVTSQPVNTLMYKDLPPSEGQWYYRITSVDDVQNESAVSNEADVVSDGTLPRLTSVDYSPGGNVDAVSGAMAPGQVGVVLTLSEPLMAAPFFSIAPEGGMPINITLTQTSETTYTGAFTITEETPAGTAYAVFSGRDMVGNRGTDIDNGLSILIDTDGPAVRRIVLNPATPIQNDAQAPATVSVTIGLNEAVAAGTAPALDYLLSGPGRSAVSVNSLTEIAPAAGDVQTWQGQFELPADAGELDVETLQFAHQSEDRLGNVATKILAANHFQVYQGDLPPLDAPAGLSAKALAGGRIQLSWNAVDQAVGYQLYRQAPDEAQLTVLARIDGNTTFLDTTPMDGTYAYAVTSLRNENAQEAESGLSPTVSADADAQAPAAPADLTLSLTPQGIYAQWQDSQPEAVTYRLYRSDAAEITTVEGLSPVQTDINQTAALDRQPSPSDHCYAVTAVDEAGNASGVSNSAYLNFDLLPVSAITVEQTDDQLPVLSWSHPGGDIDGYHVHMGPLGGAVRVTTDPVAGLSMEDGGYGGDLREYSVVAVDANGVESPARSIMLPKVEAAPVAGSRLLRGIMNQLDFSVTNQADQGVADLQVIANVMGIDHPSETFSLAANETRTIPVVVGGYTDLADSEPLTATVQMAPQTGETARIVRTSEILVGEGMLVLQIFNEELVRGATGKVWFTLENSGQAEIEIITARNHGRYPSGDVVFSLLDADGNRLSTLDFQQATGADVVTLSNGDTVARIPAGAVYTADAVQIPVPASTPDNPSLLLEIADIYHHCGRDGELIMRGMSTSRQAALVEAPYNGTISAITPPVSTGEQDIVITGRAVLRDSDQAVPAAPLNLFISNNGFERRIEVTTDDSGEFSYTFSPLAEEAGVYHVAALYPDLLDRPVQATFTITHIGIEPSRIRLTMPKNYQQTIPIKVTAAPGTQAHNLRLVYDDWDQGADVLSQGVTYDTGETIALLDSGAGATINVTLASDNSAPDAGSLVLRLVSDETAAQPWGYVEIDARFSAAEPVLVPTPHFVEIGVLTGAAANTTVLLENKGLADLDGVTLSLTNAAGGAAPGWILLNGSTDVGTLAVGDQKNVSLTFAPDAAVSDGLYAFNLNIQAADYPDTIIPIYVSVTPEGIGNALFKVKDLFTGSLNARNEVIQGVEGARITLENEKNQTVHFNQTTDAVGESLFANLPAGIYKYRIQADNHQEKIGRLWIYPAITTTEDLFIDYNLITVEWAVKEITIEDKYQIVLNITYETDVPAPVVVCDPPSVPLPDLKAGDVLNGEFTLTNHGLIRADNLEIHLPADDEYIKYELLAPLPPSLGAKERIAVPYRLTCVKSINPDDEVQSGGGSGCYRSCASTSYEGVNANGCPYSGSALHCFYASCSGGSGGSSSGSGGGTHWYDAGYGYGACSGPNCHTGSGNGVVATRIRSAGEPCTPPPGDDGANSRCGGGSGGNGGQCKKDCQQPVCQPSGSWVNLFMRSYTDDATDLAVKVPGGSIDIKRSFFNEGYKSYADSWHWQHRRSLEFDIKPPSPAASAGGGSGGGSSSGSSAAQSIDPTITTTDGTTVTLKPIKKEGVWYRPDKNTSSIDLGAGQTIVLRPDESTGRTDRIVYQGDNIWRWQDKYGNWEDYYFEISRLQPTYNAQGLVKHGYLTAYGDRTGTLAKLIYDLDSPTSPVLTGIADRNDRQVFWYAYADGDAGRNIIRIRDMDDRQIEYETSAHTSCGVSQDLLHRSIDADGFETLFEYETIPSFKWSEAAGSSTGAAAVSSKSGSGGSGSSGSISCTPVRMGLTKVTDALGREKTITYGTNGGVASVLDPDGNGYFYEYSYDEESSEYYAQKRDTNGKVEEIWINADSEASRVDVNGRTVKSFAKDGNRHTIIDENGNLTIKTYDQWDNLTQVTYPDETAVNYTYDTTWQKVIKKIDENQVVTTYEYDDAGNLTRRTEAKDTTNERVTEVGYDAESNLTTIRRPADADTAEAVTTMTYDADGNLETLTDPENNVTTFTYDVRGNVLTKTDPRDKTWTYTYDAAGRLKTVTDPLNNATEYFYDAMGNKIRALDPEGKETQYDYDARDNLKKVINPLLEETRFDNTFDGRITRQTDAENRTQRYEYDADGRLAKTIDGNANEIAMAYSGSGSGCASCGGGNNTQPAVIQFPTFTREIQYDGRGRKYVQRDLADGENHLTRFGHDAAGNLTQKTDAEGKVTAYAYDALNRLTKVTDADNNATLYAYDNRDNLIALTDAEDQTTRFEYDRNNRLVKEIRPMGEETAYDYDGAGNLIEKIDPKNQRSEYLYDDAGRLAEIRYYASGDHVNAVKTVTFSYDKAGNLTGYDDGTTSAVYTYDDAYRKTGETVHYPGYSLTSAYTYYKNGQKKSFTGPDGIAYGFLYDSNNQLTGIQIPNVGMFTVNDYKWNRPATETLPGGAQRLYSYDELMRTAGIAARDPGGHDQLNYAYTYDKVDNVTAKATGHGDYGYTYDDLYRLTDADNPDGQADESFTYDGVGNRLTAADIAGQWGYNDNNELEGYDDVTFQYDADGNMIEKSVGGVVTRFFYNLENRLERVEDGSGSVIATYYYDPFGRRLWKDVGGTRTCFFYSDEGLVGEFDGVGAEIKTYGWKPGSTWSTDPLFMKIGAEYYWYHNDHLGTPQVMTTLSGAVVWSAKYTSFGKAAVDSGSTVVNPLRFPGQYEDGETGLHHNYFRFYDKNIGRYLRSDPVGYEGGINFYLYTLANPLNFVDPKGLYRCVYIIADHRMVCVSNNGKNPNFDSDNYVSGNNQNPCYGDIRNDPRWCNVQDHGPIPTGDYTIGPQRTGSSRRDLTPDPNNNMHGRFGFQTHGCGDPNSCSEGCIAATTNATRDNFNTLMSLEEGNNTLTVIDSLDSDPNLRGL